MTHYPESPSLAARNLELEKAGRERTAFSKYKGWDSSKSMMKSEGDADARGGF